MTETPDLFGLALAAGVIALFAWYFVSVGRRMLTGAQTVSRYLDGRAERQRTELEREAREGPAPLWLKAARILVLTALMGAIAALFWMRFNGL